MKPNENFVNRPLSFWADVRMISQETGYSKNGNAISPTREEIIRAYRKLGFQLDHIIVENSTTAYGQQVKDYLDYRRDVLNNQVEKLLMDKEEAVKIFTELREKLKPRYPVPLNKQKGEKAGPAYFTGIVNMLIESCIGDNPCNFDPHSLPVVSIDGKPIQVLSRRVDGAFPNVLNPVSIWEIKEYYNTTTFGSRAADGVYETQVDGMELRDLLEHTGKKVFHYLMVDSHYTWWGMGISYLCRMIDILHMGYIDEVLFGREVTTRLPVVIPEWLASLTH
jgi:hypothetical protein